MAIPILWTLVHAHSVSAAEKFDAFVYEPRAIRVRHVSHSTSLVHATTELLHAQNSKQQEDEEHEEDSVSQVRKRAQQSADQSSHLRERMDALQWPEDAKNSECADALRTFCAD